MEIKQDKVKETFDHKEKDGSLKEGDLVLLWEKRKEKPDMLKKLDGLWTWPYKIVGQVEVNYFSLSMLEGEVLRLLVNVIHLKNTCIYVCSWSYVRLEFLLLSHVDKGW